MSRPKKPPNFNEYLKLWQDYFVRYDRWIVHKREQNKRYRVKHHEQEKQRHKTARANNPEKYREYGRRYRMSDKGKAAAVKNSLKFLDNHPEIPERYLNMIEKFIRVSERNTNIERIS
jgi:hypothetical protein